MVSSKTILSLAALAASVVDAHMKMSHPYPYGPDSLNNSPMAADGSDFPCKQRPGVYAPPAHANNFKIGESQKLTFVGSATHGGGSCQVSLTKDMKPSKSSEWQVIKSFEGGCVADVEGNMSGGASAVDPFKFNFTVPDSISPGQYTLAWTWFNRIGNREMYMNCAPITVSGASAKRSEVESAPEVDAGVEAAANGQSLNKRSDLPAMFVANINGCTTKEGIDIRFPYPGPVVEFDGNPANLQPKGEPACTGTPTFGGAADPGAGGGLTGGPSGSGSGSGSDSGSGSNSGSNSGSGGSNSGSGSSGSGSVPPNNTPTPQPQPPSTSTPPASQGNPSSEAPTQTPSPAPVPSNPNTGSGSDSSSSSGSSSGSGSTSSGALTGPCSNEGTWNCIGGTSFQRCASGLWSAVQQMAAGTQCNAGVSQEMAISAVAVERAVHGHRRRSHGHLRK